MSNQLLQASSPYLRQHAENPVNWYPWCEEAFARARAEDKPVFLSIGYSTCHWCHVMAHESFEDEAVADLLNRHFVAIKVDKEERPDIDAIYMRVCQAFTGGGGWPTSIFMTPEQKPFFAGTYFPKRSRYGMIGFMELLTAICEKWESDRPSLLDQAEQMVSHLSLRQDGGGAAEKDLLEKAVSQYRRSYDAANGGFGRAPKFPTPHNLLFLIENHRRGGGKSCLAMAEHTLMQMYRGGLFDHVGGGFSRYSTDAEYLVPHFEKMLYDNALLMLAYCRARAVASDEAKSALFLEVAERTAEYVLREMTSPEGGFYSAQDADSEGEEGLFYLFTPDELKRLIPPEDFQPFCRHYGISQKGNFEGRNILNLLDSDPFDSRFDRHLKALDQYRKDRYELHLDDKILTAWNGLMIAAMCEVYLESRDPRYLAAAKNADRFILERLHEEGNLYASFAAGRRGVPGFLDDYAAYGFAQLSLYRATLDHTYLDRAQQLCSEALRQFHDEENGGFFFSGEANERLILTIKETYDGAVPSGNSLMAWNLVRLWQMTEDESLHAHARQQLAYLSTEAGDYPISHAMFLCALQELEDPSMKVTIVSEERTPDAMLVFLFPASASVAYRQPTQEYPLRNGRTTFYLCKGRQCCPPVNDPKEVLAALDGR